MSGWGASSWGQKGTRAPEGRQSGRGKRRLWGLEPTGKLMSAPLPRLGVGAVEERPEGHAGKRAASPLRRQAQAPAPGFWAHTQVTRDRAAAVQ